MERTEMDWGCIPPGYTVGFDQGRPGGDKSVMVIFDRKNGRIIKMADVTDYGKVKVEWVRESIFARIWRAAREWMATKEPR